MRRNPILLLAVILTSSAGAAEPAPKPLPGDEQDLVFLQAARPYRLRLHQQLDGLSYQHQWNDIFLKLFQFLDQNSDGVLSAMELEHAPSPNQLRAMIQGASEVEADEPPKLADVTDHPSTGVTLPQLRGYYQRAGVAPSQAEWSGRTSDTELFDEKLFEMMAGKRSDTLTREQLKNAPALLPKLDLDNDELITLPELRSDTGYQGFATPQLLGAKNGPFLLLDLSDRGRTLLAQRLLKEYDENKDGKLSPAEIALPAEMFKALDANHDGFLDRAELAHFPDLPPDLELLVRLDAPESEGVYLLGDENGKPRALASKTHFTRIGAAQVKFPGEQVEIVRVEGMPVRLQQMRQASMQLFRSLDDNRDGVLESKEVFKPPFSFVPYMRLADRDGDGKVTEKEFQEFLDLQQKLVVRTTILNVVDRGRSLFDLLDADHDHRLSRRELMTACERISPWIDPKTQTLEREKIPRQFQIVLSLGRASDPSGDPGGVAVLRPAARLRGPLWFRKMDRNADGDVSRAEFLGTEEQFRKLDLNGDGLIDVKEAEAASKKK